MNIHELQEKISEKEFDFVRGILNITPNVRVFLVGGIVRDALLGRENPDYDFVVENIEIDKLVEILKGYGRVTDVSGRNFGVIKFTPEGEKRQFDLSIPRTERYQSGKRRSDAEVKTDKVTLKDDFMRRDFTVNAIAIPLNKVISTKSDPLSSRATGRESRDLLEDSSASVGMTGNDGLMEIYDLFGGVEDIQNKIIRAVGDPEERFEEDPTRILRAVRFACRLDFEIEPETFSAMKKLKGEILKTFEKEDGTKLQRVSNEMIGIEIAKAIEGNPIKFLSLFDDLGLLPELLPEIEKLKGVEQPIEWHSEGDAFVHTKLVVSNIPADSSLELKLAALFHDIGKYDTREPKTVNQLISKSANQQTIHFYGHDKVSVEKARLILNRYRFKKDLIENVSWLIENHMRIMSFPQMRIFKQKDMARHPQFLNLIKLSEADDAATIPTTAKKSVFLPTVREIVKQLEEEEKAGKPRQILNGNEIIELLKREKPGFDIKSEGKLIGELKRKVNEEYDEGLIKSKNEALDWLRSNV